MTKTYHLTGTLRGTELSEAWVSDGVISHVAPEGVDPRAIEEISGFVYPGLLDAHTHPAVSRGPEPVPYAETLERLRAHRAWGVTAIRDCGGRTNPNDAVADAIESGDGDAQNLPKVLHCARHIARFKRYILHLPVDVEPDGFVAEVQRQAARSDGWIKIVGDWIDRSLGDKADLAPLWPAEVMRDGVAAAHDMGVKVAVHTFAAETIRSLLDAGVDSIEHGTGMTFDEMVEARERGILLTPTVRQVARFPEFAADATKYPVYAQRMLEMDARRAERVAQMVEAGSLFLMGSDTTPTDEVEDRGLPVELDKAVADGMPASVAMEAASYGGRSRLGLSTWEAGAAADFVVYSADPELDIAQVRQPKAVLINGQLC